MYLVGAKGAVEPSPDEQLPQSRLPSEPWHHFPYSGLSHHRSACCEVAREWLIAMDFAQLNGAALVSGPRWLRAKYKWGPSTWPIHWCEVVRSKTIDCGAHASLSRELFRARGVTAFPAQLVQLYTKETVEQWRGQWTQEEASCHWLDREHIYHEATAVLLTDLDSKVKIWDSSSASWIEPHLPTGGYGSVVAVRINAGLDYKDGLIWVEEHIAPDVWNQLG